MQKEDVKIGQRVNYPTRKTVNAKTFGDFKDAVIDSPDTIITIRGEKGKKSVTLDINGHESSFIFSHDDLDVYTGKPTQTADSVPVMVGARKVTFTKDGVTLKTKEAGSRTESIADLTTFVDSLKKDTLFGLPVEVSVKIGCATYTVTELTAALSKQKEIFG